MNVTAPTPVRSICFRPTDEPARLTTVIGTGRPSALCCDTPADISPSATTTVGERSTSTFSDVIAGMPCAPRSVYTARRATTPCGASPEPAGGVYEPLGGGDRGGGGGAPGTLMV